MDSMVFKTRVMDDVVGFVLSRPRLYLRGLCERERAQDQVMILPLYHQMSEADVDRVSHGLREALRAP
jgi:hypothetical protein